jgi:hypothetical protein
VFFFNYQLLMYNPVLTLISGVLKLPDPLTVDPSLYVYIYIYIYCIHIIMFGFCCRGHTRWQYNTTLEIFKYIMYKNIDTQHTCITFFF